MAALLSGVKEEVKEEIYGFGTDEIVKATCLQVFDHDTFSADDIMGEVEIDIQPLITSAMAFGDPGILEDMQIGKWLKSEDNALLEDSIMNIIDGKVIQEVTLKLQNIESGEIDLRIDWMPIHV